MSVPLKQMTTSPQGLAVIKHFEGCELTAYLCPSKIITIGFGHTGSDVKLGDTITQAQADELLQQDIRKFEDGVFRYVRVPVSQGQFDALVSFTFNIGLNAFRNSTMLNYLNRGMYPHARDELIRWDKGTVNGNKVVLPGLVARREMERKLWEGQEVTV